MGMQIYFHHSDLPECTVIHEADDFCELSMPDGKVTAWRIGSNDYYFDCGRTSKEAMENIANLIRNRVCFSAS